MKYLSTQNERRKWRKRIKRQQETGKPISTWCTENSISVGQFHYWKRRLFPKPVEQVSSNDCSHQFIELTEKGHYSKKQPNKLLLTRREFFMLLEGITPKRLQKRYEHS